MIFSCLKHKCVSHPVLQSFCFFTPADTGLLVSVPLLSQEVCELTLCDPVLATISLERGGNLRLE